MIDDALDKLPNGDDKDSGEGAKPPNQEPHRAKRVRKLSGPVKLMMQDLVYSIWKTASDQGNQALAREMLVITARWL